MPRLVGTASSAPFPGPTILGPKMNPKSNKGPTEPTDRSKCPPDDRVRALANGELPENKELQGHISQCAACAREYQDHLKDLASQRFIKRSTRISYVVGAGILV